MIQRKHHRRALRSVVEDYHSYHARILALIEKVPDEDLVTMRRFSWTGPSRTLSDYVRGKHVGALSLGRHADQAMVARAADGNSLAFTIAYRPVFDSALP